MEASFGLDESFAAFSGSHCFNEGWYHFEMELVSKERRGIIRAW